MDYNDKCRKEIINGDKFLMSKLLYKTEEEKKALNINLDDFGRVRNFKRNKFSDWCSDPIPMDIVSKRLNMDRMDNLDVQMVEVAKCNLHCWWCYLPDELRHINEKYMKWFSPQELLDLVFHENANCKCLYVSGGNPELVPELIYDIMKELSNRGLSDKLLLWSDDVLSTDYVFNMDIDKLKYMLQYKNYAKICCLKGFDDQSFSFNTLTKKEGFQEQLERLKKNIDLGFDTYCYVVLTCEDLENIDKRISDFIEKLQNISYYLPLRVIPIKIEKFSAVIERLNDIRNQSIINQYKVLDVWNSQIEKSYSKKLIKKNISDIVL